MTVIIHLTRGYEALVDDIDSDLAEYNWKANVARYAYRSVWDNKKSQLVLLHRVILERMLGRALLNDELSDHRDTNPANCCRNNLRLATRLQNSSNRRMNKNNTSGYKGVRLDKDSKNRPWIATISFQGVIKSLGSFDNPLSAHRAYAIAALTYHKDFANLGESSPFTGFTLEQLTNPIIQLALPLKEAA
jgi:hypothetical protein